MLSVISQDRTRKYDIAYYFIAINEPKIIGSFGNVIGEYSTPEKAKKVFKMMIEAEEKQNSLIGTIRESDYWQDIVLKTFEIFRMPQDEEVKE